MVSSFDTNRDSLTHHLIQRVHTGMFSTHVKASPKAICKCLSYKRSLSASFTSWPIYSNDSKKCPVCWGHTADRSWPQQTRHMLSEGGMEEEDRRSL